MEIVPSAPPEQVIRGMEGSSGSGGDDNIVHVAVCKEVKESKSVLLWALENFKRKRICVMHVHQLSKMMVPMPLGGRFHASKLGREEVQAYKEKILNEHLNVCARKGVRAEKLDIERENIEQGIMELVVKHKIKRLVMGAALDRHYFKKMTQAKSKKAIFISQEAQTSCNIWFVCNGHLIQAREANLDETCIDALPLQLDQVARAPQLDHLQCSKSLNLDLRPRITSPVQDLYYRVKSARSASHATRASRFPSPEVSYSSSVSGIRSEGLYGSSSSLSVNSEEEVYYPALPNEVEGSNSVDNENIYQLLQRAMVEAENSKREAIEESVRRWKAEKVYIEAITHANKSEKFYASEMKQRIELQEALARDTQELNRLTNILEEVRAQLSNVDNQKEDLEFQISDSEKMIKELEMKLTSSVELMKTLREEIESLQLERDNAIAQATELKMMRAKSVCSKTLSNFSFLDIEEATHGFDQSLIIEGVNGSVYRGFLHGTEVAIKMLQSNSSGSCSEYQREVDILSRIRQPNLITLIGTCSDANTLVLEYLPNGTLEDRLVCKDNTPPLSWETRIRIAVEICSGLIFLHSNKPNSIIHGNLKPSNIFLDAKFSIKLSDFGTFKDPNGVSMYTDPEFLETGVTPKSDVYSFGVILLRLLIGRLELDIASEVETALVKGKFADILDFTAGDWPFVRAKQLAYLALRCCSVDCNNRPNLVSEVWKVLEPMKVLCGTSTSFRVKSEESCRVPSYFVCPILQEIMQDPHIAADGFTYEAEAIKGWIDGGHKTSPMTNLELTHCSLTPNLSLRSAIQEWLQQP